MKLSPEDMQLLQRLMTDIQMAQLALKNAQLEQRLAVMDMNAKYGVDLTKVKIDGEGNITE